MLKEKIQEDIDSALREKRETEVSVLRMLKAAIFNKEKEKRYKLSREKPELTEKELEKESSLADEEVVEVISSEIKKRRESVESFEKGGRKELADKEKKESEFLQRYLPEQMPEEEIRKLVEQVLAKAGAKEIKEMGKVMQELMPRVKGKADGGLVSRVVKELLSSKH